MSFSRLPDTMGFDEQLDVLTLSVGKSTSLYLANCAGQPIAVRSADPNVASVAAEVDLTSDQRDALLKQATKLPPGVPDPLKNLNDSLAKNPTKPSNQQSLDKNLDAYQKSRFGAVNDYPALALFPMSKITVRGETVGETQLVAALLDGTQWQKPTWVVVVQNSNCRQIDIGPVPLSLVRELQSKSLRDAAVRVAQDQINSAMTKQSTGDARYDLPGWAASGDWCGAFVYWCYRKAAEIKGVANPFGGDNDVMLSPQKAISWALNNREVATLIRYTGGAFFLPTPPPQNAFIDVVPGTNLRAGDVCLLRKADGSDWQHVCLVYDPGSGDSFLTLDGNQGNPSMKMVMRDMNEKTAKGDPRYVFVHLNLP
jgi:hypothetical protein